MNTVTCSLRTNEVPPLRLKWIQIAYIYCRDSCNSGLSKDFKSETNLVSGMLFHSEVHFQINKPVSVNLYSLSIVISHKDHHLSCRSIWIGVTINMMAAAHGRVHDKRWISGWRPILTFKQQPGVDGSCCKVLNCQYAHWSSSRNQRSAVMPLIHAHRGEDKQ